MILDILKKIFHIGTKVTEVIEEATNRLPSVSKKELAFKMLSLFLETENIKNVPDIINNFIIEGNVFLKKYNGNIDFYEEGEDNVIKITFPKNGGVKINCQSPDTKSATRTPVDPQITDSVSCKPIPIANESKTEYDYLNKSNKTT